MLTGSGGVLEVEMMGSVGVDLRDPKQAMEVTRLASLKFVDRTSDHNPFAYYKSRLSTAFEQLSVPNLDYVVSVVEAHLPYLLFSIPVRICDNRLLYRLF